MSKELQDIKKAIGKYIEKYKGDVVVHGSFIAFKGKNCEVINDIMFSYGDKETLKIDIEYLLKQIKKEKESFINC